MNARSPQRRLAVIAITAVLAVATGGAHSAVGSPQDGSAPPVAAEPEVVAAMYDKGLDFLLTAQKDAVWEDKPGHQSPEYTAIATSCFLERPGGVRAKDEALTGKAVEFLVGQIGDDGFMKGAASQSYALSVAVQAFVATGREDLKPVIGRCLEVIRTCQVVDAADPNFGGIGYVPGVGPPRPPSASGQPQSPGSHANLSSTVYALASLRAAGVKEDDPVFKRALTYLQRVQNRKENETEGEPKEWKDKDGKTVVRGNDGGATYSAGRSVAGFDERPDGVRVLRSYGSMTYALLGCYHMAGLPASDGRVKAAADWISKNFTLDRNPGMPDEAKTTALLYSYHAMATALSLAKIDTIDKDGKSIDWRRALAEQLAKTQQADGSWVNGIQRYMEGNPVVATSLALLSLSAAKR